jgi:hypothetical protein
VTSPDEELDDEIEQYLRQLDETLYTPNIPQVMTRKYSGV